MSRFGGATAASPNLRRPRSISTRRWQTFRAITPWSRSFARNRPCGAPCHRTGEMGHDRAVTWDGESYQQRFDALAADGADVHGEADFVEQLHPSFVLDAGCGTGRVARELARRGIGVVGVDRDQSMIATAARLAPELTWLVRDLTQIDLDRCFDVVLLAGNVPIFTPDGTQAALVAGCARHLVDQGLLV